MNALTEDPIDEWFVTNGIVAVGPLHFQRVAEGIAQGRISTTSFVRHTSWRIWQRLDEIDALSEAARREAILRLGGISATAEERASDPLSVPPPPLDPDIDSDPLTELPPPLSSIRPAAVNPVGVLAKAPDLETALQLSLSTAVAASTADAGLIHCDRLDLDAVVTTYALGTRAETLLGDRLAEDDPSVAAARAGQTILTEPVLGPAGRYIAGRFSRCLDGVRGMAMVPVMLFGRLIAMVEVGRMHVPFRAREIARVEDVVEALTARIVVSGWID